MLDNPATVLYVDDNPRSSRLLAGVLEQCGFRVTAKNDPAEALTLCRRSSFDVALLDYEMPTMNGSRLAREIKYLMPDLPVILLSGRTELPAAELEFVDAHFGFGTSLDDLLWTMRILAKPRVFVPEHRMIANREKLRNEASVMDDRQSGMANNPEDDHGRGNTSKLPGGHGIIESRWSDST
jgi:CheY-like chemotaxis protein